MITVLRRISWYFVLASVVGSQHLRGHHSHQPRRKRSSWSLVSLCLPKQGYVSSGLRTAPLLLHPALSGIILYPLGPTECNYIASWELQPLTRGLYKPTVTARMDGLHEGCKKVSIEHRSSWSPETPLTLLHEGILQQARDNPFAVAVVETTPEVHRHTFADLRQFAFAIRQALPPASSSALTRNIGIIAEGGGFALYASWLALLWAGYTVVPLSAAAPAARTKAICIDAQIVLILVTDAGGAIAIEALQNEDGDLVQTLDVRPLQADSETYMGDDYSICTATGPCTVSSPREGGYLYYTSGSSGKPKAVFSGHAPIMNRLHWMWRRWPYTPDEVCCQRVSHVFIDFVAELFGPLSRGISLLVAPCAVHRNPVQLRDFIRTYRVTRVTLVPMLARLLVQTTTAATTMAITDRDQGDQAALPTQEGIPFFADIRLWILSGEILTWSVARGLARHSSPDVQVLNLYGATEVAADITFYTWSPGDIHTHHDENGGNRINLMNNHAEEENSLSVPIGCPITGCGAELMALEGLEGEGRDLNAGPPEFLRPISRDKSGRVGALYVYGEGLAGGYWGRPDLTEERFPRYVWDVASFRFRLCHSSLLSNCAPAQAPRPLSDTNEGVTSRATNFDVDPGCRNGKVVRFFRTGDLASYQGSPVEGGGVSSGLRDDGWHLVYRGRTDQQIKIQGQRLDLAEIEVCAVRAPEVKSAAAVALSGVDRTLLEMRQEERFDSDSSFGTCIIGVVVCPEVVDRAAVVAKCGLFLPSFAVPHVVVTAEIIPTLTESGKVDRQEVRRMVQAELARGDDCAIMDSESADENGVPLDLSCCIKTDDQEAKVMDLITKAVECTFQVPKISIDTAKIVGGQTRVDADSDFFSELGMSSLESVRLVHELRRRLSHTEFQTAGGQQLRVLGLVDIYLHSSARKLARWLVPISSFKESALGGLQERHPSSQGGQRGNSNAEDVAKGESALCTRGQWGSHRQSNIAGISVEPITTDLQLEASALLSEVFLQAEPLLSARFARSRACGGPPTAALMRRCYKAAVRWNIDYLLRSGGRVIAATDNATGRIVGVTVGTELVKSIEGLGFFSGAGRRRIKENGWMRRKWGTAASTILYLSLRPMMDPITALINELLSTYQNERGWTYAPGEVVYISETGCHPDLLVGEGDGKGGMRAAVLAESLEQRLLREATAAGFIRAITICTNAVTVHVARELGFREVARVSPIQEYDTQGRWPTMDRPSLASFEEKTSRHDRHGFGIGVPDETRISDRRVEKKDGKRRRRGPFASVSSSQRDVVLFEKCLAPRLPPDLLLGEINEPMKLQQAITANSSTEGISLSAHLESLSDREAVSGVSGNEMWKLVNVGNVNEQQLSEMLAVLANSLPDLAASGRAIKYMADDDDRGQTAFVLLTAHAVDSRGVDEAKLAATGKDKPHFVSVHLEPTAALSWTVAACISWRRFSPAITSSDEKMADAGKFSGMTCGGRGDNETAEISLHSSWAELLLLAVGRRWRYRGIGAALLARFLAESRRQGERRVYVRSLVESVSFYEQHGFFVTDMDAAAENGGDSATPRRAASNAECLLVREFERP